MLINLEARSISGGIDQMMLYILRCPTRSNRIGRQNTLQKKYLIIQKEPSQKIHIIRLPIGKKMQ
jgi:hypothetical protein